MVRPSANGLLVGHRHPNLANRTRIKAEPRRLLPLATFAIALAASLALRSREAIAQDGLPTSEQSSVTDAHVEIAGYHSPLSPNQDSNTARGGNRGSVGWSNEDLTRRLYYETDDGAFSYLFDGRILLDAAFYNEHKNPLASGAEVRDARAGIKAKLWRDWRAELDLNFADNEVGLRDAWVAYAGLDSAILKIGNFKEPFSLEELHSKRFITFMERATINVFAPSRHIGIGYNQWGSWWQFGTGFFGQEAGDFDNRDIEKMNVSPFRGHDQGYGASGRLTLTPIQTRDWLLHLGAATAFRAPDLGEDPGDLDRVRFRTRPETDVNRTRFVNTGRMRAVDYYVVYGLELAGNYRSLSFQSEYMQNFVQRVRGRPDVTFDGAYFQLSWLVTGESRPYDVRTGEFQPILPEHDFGAWELAARYSIIDLNDVSHGVRGGREEIVTIGINWYINTNMRLMLNLSHVNNDRFANDNGDVLGGDHFEILQTRCQVTF